MLEFNTAKLYKQIIGRYIKVLWTHKIHECQADIHHKHLERVQKWIGILTALTATGTVAALIPFENENIDKVGVWLTAVFALILSYLNFRYKDGILDKKIEENKSYAAKLHHLRNLYESLMTDIVAEKIDDQTIIARRDELEQMENELYSQNTPITSEEALKMAKKAIKGDQDSTTTEEEEQIILPDFLKV